MIRGSIVLLIAALIGCVDQEGDAGASIVNDANETFSRKIVFPGRTSPSSVLYGKRDAYICEGKYQTALEILEGLDRAVPHENGYSFLDVESESRSYRAYFKKTEIRSQGDAIYVFCSGAGSPLITNRCSIQRVSEKGCSSVDVLGATNFKDVDAFILELKKYPY